MPTPNERVERILAEAVGSDLSSWEKFDFLPNVRTLERLSRRQEQVLREIEERLFGESCL